MKKVFVIGLTLLLSVMLATAAFAGEINKVVFYGNAGSGSISFGSHGHSWYSDSEEPGFVMVRGAFHNNSYKNEYWPSYYGNAGKVYYYPPEYRSFEWFQSRYYDSDGDGQWHFYKDDEGAYHYFYIDPDWEGEFHRYTDENGDAQYYYQYTGLKTIK